MICFHTVRIPLLIQKRNWFHKLGVIFMVCWKQCVIFSDIFSEWHQWFVATKFQKTNDSQWFIWDKPLTWFLRVIIYSQNWHEISDVYLFSSQRFRGYILALERQALTFKRPEGLRGCYLWPPNGIHSLSVLCVKHFCWHPAMRRWWVNLAAECVLWLHPTPCRFSEEKRSLSLRERG